MEDIYLLPHLNKRCVYFGQINFVFPVFAQFPIGTHHLMICIFVSGSKVAHASAVTEGQREALRFKLDATCVWFSISTCHSRQAAGLMLSVTPNRWAPAL